MIKIKYFNSIIEAQLAENILKEHGIKSWIEKRGVQFPGDLGDSYGAYLFVNKKDVKTVKDLLDVQDL